VVTTANFAPHNRLVTWYIGGLNYQIEHHLLSKVCHIHYPAMSEMVEKTCREFAISYTCYPTLRSAIVAHLQFLKKMYLDTFTHWMLVENREAMTLLDCL